jgi:hypothetical protein
MRRRRRQWSDEETFATWLVLVIGLIMLMISAAM